ARPHSRYLRCNRTVRTPACAARSGRGTAPVHGRGLLRGRGGRGRPGKEGRMGLASLLLSGLMACPAALPQGVYAHNTRALQIPININPARRHEIRELLLFVSTDGGRHWSQEAVATPDKQFFPYYAKADGVHWFSVVVVNQQGARDPQDVYA